jgi:tetratricopeptide (TPR) repeat protein
MAWPECAAPSVPVLLVRALRLACLLTLLSCVLTSRVTAQASSAKGVEPVGYRAAVDAGLQEFGLNNYEEAREHFVRAHALYPNARTFRGLGLVEFELRHYVEAVDLLERALANTTKPLDGKMRGETEALLGRARGYVGTIDLSVSPAQATLQVDDTASTASAPKLLRLTVGEHVLVLTASGFKPERRVVKVRGGESEAVTIALAPIELEAAAPAEGAASPHVPDQAPRSEVTPVYKRWWVWTLVTVAIAGGAVGLGLGLRRDKDREYRAVPSDNTPDGLRLQPLVSF